MQSMEGSEIPKLTGSRDQIPESREGTRYPAFFTPDFVMTKALA
jgi:hypothetical protein